MDFAHPHLIPNSLHAKIVFYSMQHGNTEVYSMGLDESNQTRLTFNGVDDSWVA